MINLDACHAGQLKTLTGCRYAVLRLLHARIRRQQPAHKRGPPYRHSLWAMLLVSLIKLRNAMSYRVLSVLTGIAHVTLARIVERICRLLASLPLARQDAARFLIVDTTSCRVRSKGREDYSGYKHHRLHKL
jgi:hypothetical protein